MASNGEKPKLHFAMFPWFAFGHFTPYLHLSNKLAQRGHAVSFLLPKKALLPLQDQNLHPDLITFYPLTIPTVDGLPQGAETASDVPYASHTHLAKAFDLTHDQVQAFLSNLAPDFIFYDLGHWVPEIASILGIKAVMYSVLSATCVWQTEPLTKSTGQRDAGLDVDFGQVGLTFRERIRTSLKSSDAVCFRTCTEIEGKIIEYIKESWEKPVLLTGSGLPELDVSSLDPKWESWLNTFSPSKVIFCALGTQIVLEKPQFQELVLGFEAIGLPFLVILKPPVGSDSVEEALPEGFKERVEGRGVVYGGWVQQALILKHPSIGCFVSHCGYGSMWEGLVSECGTIVALPFLYDQVLNAKMLADEMKMAVVVEREEESGWISKERLCEAVKSVMDEESQIGEIVRRNHFKYREVLVKDGFMSGYIDKFVEDLQQLKNTS
ncbi:unnamed protein product [Rhodiola kirilowii]